MANYGREKRVKNALRMGRIHLSGAAGAEKRDFGLPVWSHALTRGTCVLDIRNSLYKYLCAFRRPGD